MKKQLAMLAVGLVTVLVLAGQLARAANAPILRNDSHPVWSYDARHVVFAIGNSTTAIVPTGHGAERVIRSGIPRGWRPGGDEFLDQVATATFVVASDGRIVAGVPGRLATWSPDGGRLAYLRDGFLWIASATGEGVRQLYGPFQLPTWEIEGPVWSPDGTQIVVATTDGLRIVNADGTGSRLVFTGENQSVNPSWSRTQNVIAFERNAGAHWSIWLVDPDGSNAHALLSGAVDYRFPQFGPFGQLAFTSNRQHIPGGATPFQYALYVQQLGGQPYRVLDDVRPDEPAAWSPTGAQLAAAAGQECLRFGVYVVSSAQGGHGRRRSNICRFDGTANADTLRGSPYHDLMNGNGGNDVLYGNGGDDKISGESGNDTIYGGAGNDFVLAGPGDDTVHGGAGNDTIIGGNGRDRIDCGPGNDTVEGAGPLDRIAGNCEHVRH
jgi:Tol biopolymer transport system component